MSTELVNFEEPMTGTVYMQFQDDRHRNISSVQNGMEKVLKQGNRQKSGDLVLQSTTPLDEVLDCILPEDGRQRTFFVSNASIQENTECHERKCVLGDHASCTSQSRNCRNLILRPDCDIPSLEEMFPGSEVLGIKGFLRFCPMNANGSVFIVTNLVWLPKCERRSYEREVVAQIAFATQSPFHRPDNLLRESFLAGLPPISIQTQKVLRKWQEYLDWRERLISANKQGIRYTNARKDSKRGTIDFLTVFENKNEFQRNLRWLRSEEICLFPLGYSGNVWKFQTVEEHREATPRTPRERGVRMGTFMGVEEVKSESLRDCPWNRPYFARVTFSLPDNLKNFPEDGGFLCPSSFGDDVLLGRLQNTVQRFMREGSLASPFLSSWIFDIGNARLPKNVEELPDPEWRNPNLNEAQKKAVKVMIAAPDVALIQGPPGTGKTTVIAEATAQFVRQGLRVLITSQSIAAVENALERLENVPELRALCLKKTFHDHEEPTCRYAEKNVLRNYYQTLGLGATQDLERWEQLDRQFRDTEHFHEQLVVIENRIRLEKEQIQKQETAIQQFQNQQNAASSRQNENLANQRKKEAGQQFLAWIQSQMPAEFDVHKPEENMQIRDLDVTNPPAELLLEFAREVLPTLEEPRTHGVVFLVETLDSEWPVEMKLTAIRQALTRFRKCVDIHLPYFKKELERLHRQSGEEVLSSLDRLKLEDLKAKIQELELQKEEADQNNNDELYEKLEERGRLLHREKRALIANSSLDETHFSAVFSEKNAEGVNLSAYALSPQRTRSELTAFLEKYLRFFDDLKRRFAEKVEHFQLKATHILEEMDVEEETFSRQIRHFQSEIKRAQELCEESRQKLALATQNGRTILMELRKTFSLPKDALPTVAQGSAWCARAHKELQQHIDESRPEREIFAPILKAWTERLQNVTIADEDHVLPIYRENCSVLGITCTANDLSLRDLGYDNFDVVIIDEVSKATPPEILRSMMMGKKTILVGDHRQLPPLFSEREPLTFEEIVQQEEEDESIPDALKIVTQNFRKYRDFVESSYFKVNFEKADSRLKSMLQVQFRMHSQIMDLINEFYEGRLSSGIQNEEETRRHFLEGPKIPYVTENGHAYWVDSSETPNGKLALEEMSGHGSYQNRLEVQLILKTLQDMDAALDGKTLNGQQIHKTVGIIAFYGKQTGLLKRMLAKQRFRNLDCIAETVDRFQGQEKDFILVSMTRNSQRIANRNSKSFVAKFERINVAFSRARELLMIYGARRMFENYEIELPTFCPENSIPQKPEKQKVYRRIMDFLRTQGRLLKAHHILSVEEWKQCERCQY